MLHQRFEVVKVELDRGASWEDEVAGRNVYKIALKPQEDNSIEKQGRIFIQGSSSDETGSLLVLRLYNPHVVSRLVVGQITTLEVNFNTVMPAGRM